MGRQEFISKNVLVSLCVMMVSFGVAAQTTTSAAQENTAQSLLFDSPYLSSMKPPGALSHGFSHTTENARLYGDTFGDKVLVRLEGPKETGKPDRVFMDVYTGAQQRNLGPFSKTNGNPIIMMFLERDVWQMKRRIGGTPSYFRNRIRKAFREAAELEPAEIRFKGNKIAAYEITIRPFKHELDKRRFREYRTKVYSFTVADKVPGGIYQIWSAIPKENSDNEYLVEDRLFLEGEIQ